MQRSEVYMRIDGEREHQDAKWGNLNERTLSMGDWLLILELELNEAKIAWCKNREGEHSVHSELRQIAAVAVAALEQHGCPAREGYESQPAAQQHNYRESKYCLIAYPDGEPVLAETEIKNGEVMIRGHGWADRLMALGCTITVLSSQQSHPDVPQPDWSQAPEWAEWWTVSAIGHATWHEREPHILSFAWQSRPHAYKSAGRINIPIGIDWRTLKQQRPAAQETADAP